MVSTVKVKISSPGVRAMLQSAGVRAELHDAADPVLDRMIAGAPEASGALKGSLYLWDDTTDRAVVRVGSDLPYAGSVAARTGFMLRALP